jgi:leucyl aminopeptidase
MDFTNRSRRTAGAPVVVALMFGCATDLSTPPGDGSVDDLIRELVGRIKPEEIEPRYRALEAMSMPNRKTGSANYTMATDWVKGWLATEAPRLPVTYDEWSTYRNVEIKIAGTDPAAGMYVIGGHLDSVTASPGMDDDGSGSLGVAILASAMSHYVYKSEIRLLIFDAEESGFIGSIHYAQALQAAGCQPDTCMKLFTNMDMLGNDPRNTGTVKVLYDVVAPKTAAQAVKGYIPGLTIQEGTGNCHSSDDCGFSRNGYPNSGELVEPVYSPQRHTVTDVCDNMNFDTLNKALQLGGAMMASMAGIHARAP